MTPDYDHPLQHLCCPISSSRNAETFGTRRSSGQKDPCQHRLAVFTSLSISLCHSPRFQHLQHIFPLETGIKSCCSSSPPASPHHPVWHHCSTTAKSALMTKESSQAAGASQVGREAALQRFLIPALEGWKCQVSSGEEQTLQVFADHSPLASFLLGWWQKVKAVVPGVGLKCVDLAESHRLLRGALCLLSQPSVLGFLFFPLLGVVSWCWGAELCVLGDRKMVISCSGWWEWVKGVIKDMIPVCFLL